MTRSAPPADDDWEPLESESERALSDALRAAYDPVALAPERHTRLLQQALAEPEAAPSSQERAAAEALRLALQQPNSQHPDAALARALVLALKPRAASPNAARPSAVLPELGLAPAEPGRVLPWRRSLAVTTLAAAAATALVLGTREEPGAFVEPPAYALSRPLSPSLPAQELSPSGRLDRIAELRARELRDNRFATWGVR